MRQKSQNRNVVLPIMADTSQVANLSFAVDSLFQNLVVNIAIDSDSVVQGQADVERKALEVSVRVNIPFLAIPEELVDAGGRFKVDDRQVRLDCVSVQSSCSRLSSALCRFCPG